MAIKIKAGLLEWTLSHSPNTNKQPDIIKLEFAVLEGENLHTFIDLQKGDVIELTLTKTK